MHTDSDLLQSARGRAPRAMTQGAEKSNAGQHSESVLLYPVSCSQQSAVLPAPPPTAGVACCSGPNKANWHCCGSAAVERPPNEPWSMWRSVMVIAFGTSGV